MTTQEAINHLINELKNDEGYRMSWKANIAVQFQHAFANHHQNKGVHEISNIAADNFLDLLTHVGVKNDHAKS